MTTSPLAFAVTPLRRVIEDRLELALPLKTAVRIELGHPGIELALVRLSQRAVRISGEAIAPPRPPPLLRRYHARRFRTV